MSRRRNDLGSSRVLLVEGTSGVGKSTLLAEILWQRGIEPRRDAQFMRYARKFGHTLENIHRHFVREQDELLQLSRASRMETLPLHVDAPVED